MDYSSKLLLNLIYKQMDKIIKSLLIITILSASFAPNALAVWRFGADLGFGVYDADSDRAPAESGELTLIGASLTFPIGLYTRYDHINADSANVTGTLKTLSFG